MCVLNERKLGYIIILNGEGVCTTEPYLIYQLQEIFSGRLQDSQIDRS